MANTSTNLPLTALSQGRRVIIAIVSITGEEKSMQHDMEELILDTRVDENGNLNNEDENSYRIMEKKHQLLETLSCHELGR